MAKFVRVTKAPTTLDEGCYIIDAPNFKAEIEMSAGKRPRNGLMAPNYLREIFAAIGSRYGDETYNALTTVNVSHYKGVPIETNEAVERIVMDVVHKQMPQFVDSYVDTQIKGRPDGTKLIYFLGNFNQTSNFTRNGIDEIKEKEIDVYLGKKKKKTVGKPAITNEEAALKADS